MQHRKLMPQEQFTDSFPSVGPVASDQDPRTAPDHLLRLAQLIARGESQVPTGVEPDALCEVLDEVARQRRARLVRYIARAIASDIYAARDQ